ncbi:extracellular solute-binding protein [Streptomyces cocklensis]|uniref:Xylobiose-binding protein n=1 Tax=Actinacidiphila cocklensis TaxID=887465 RepID=A0A9W4DJ24_9ACTN|nr:extracellular solute-binding protein [Actinacidiphila cocklensis]MDD1063639.1 extracellular solute-binding protein [Actinacidiphila cocklensis]WSX73015.1 extracellular solute-binding protein [Streptomyces sp. NBC_00899]WSX80919.1 extracellular solute-binding protein [Streptomyces sp. NBC_00899]CAG6390938.1 Xylobiose-binding protein [Actinacidiphila cocklensis]
MKKRWLPRAVAGSVVLALGLTLAACGGGSSSSSGSGSFTVLVYGDASNKVEKQIVDTFNKTSKVKAKLQTIPGADYQTKLQTLINTKQAPDVFFNWGGGSIAPFVKAGLLLPLDDMIAKDPGLKSNFLPSVFNGAVVDGKSYGIPMRGTQPVMLFNNKKVLADNGLTAPKTWDDLLNAVKVLKAKHVTPIALGGGDQWPTLMWYEYMYDRIAGPGLFEKAMGGDKSAWDSADSRAALAKLKELIDAGAFGTNYDSVKYTDGGSVALVAQSKAAFELMGSWYYSQQQQDNPDFAKSGLGYSSFPTVDGGKGDPTDIVGNTNNYYSVLKKTKYADAIAQFLKLQYSDEFVKAHMAIGNLPTTTSTVNFLGTAAIPDYAKFQFELVKAAPSFQLSWDQAYPQTASEAMHTAVQQFFDGKLDADGFIKAMQALPTS